MKKAALFVLIVILFILPFASCKTGSGIDTLPQNTPTKEAIATPYEYQSFDYTPPVLDYGDSADDNISYYVSLDGDDSNPGTEEAPWFNIEDSLSKLSAGNTLIIKAGTYDMTVHGAKKEDNGMLFINLKGAENKWFKIIGESRGSVIFDASEADIDSGTGFPSSNGLVQIEKAAYVMIKNIKILNSHESGFNIQESDHIDIINCISENSHRSGICAWGTGGVDYQLTPSTNIRILGNEVIAANLMDMKWEKWIDPDYVYPRHQAPHEAISMGGPQNFEVAYNYVHDCGKEGIDIKESSKDGRVHHNYIHDLPRQGLYVDGWRNVLENIEFDHNVVHDCENGMAFSTEDENSPYVANVKFHHNLLYNNGGAGIYFSTWGKDYPRKNIEVYNNTVYHNGYKQHESGEDINWLAGGLYLRSTNLSDISIHSNIFAKNYPFEIAYSENWDSSLLNSKNISFSYNFFQDTNTLSSPIYMWWPEENVYTTFGTYALKGDPLFIDAENGDFRLQETSSAINTGIPGSDYSDPDGSRNDMGCFNQEDTGNFWWKEGFPPLIKHQ